MARAATQDGKVTGRGSARGVPGGEPTRDKLIEAAGRVFAERGYQLATVREICRRAGANVAAINYHFGDKLGLYTAVLQHSIKAAEIDALRNAFAGEAPPEEMLRRVIRARLEAASRRGLADWQFDIMAHEFAHPTPALAHIVDTVTRPLFERMLDLVGKNLDLPGDHPTTHFCAFSIMGQLLFYVIGSHLLTMLWPQGELTPARVPAIADHIADFSLAYLHQIAAQHRQAPAAPATPAPRTPK